MLAVDYACVVDVSFMLNLTLLLWFVVVIVVVTALQPKTCCFVGRTTRLFISRRGLSRHYLVCFCLFFWFCSFFFVFYSAPVHCLWTSSIFIRASELVADFSRARRRNEQASVW